MAGQLNCQQILEEFSSGGKEQGQFFSKKFFKLNQALVGVIDGFSLVNYHTLDITDEESVSDVLMQIDNMVQYDDYRMPNDKKFMDEQDDMGNNNEGDQDY